MDQTTLTAIKAHMGYTNEEPPKCRDCKHSCEDEDQAGMWYHTCQLNPAITFTVAATGRCKHFAGKDNEQTQAPAPL